MPDQSDRQLPLRRAESAAAFVLVIQVVAGAVALMLGWMSDSAAAIAEAWHLWAGALVWIGVLVHQRLRRLAAEEALEADTLKRREGEGRGDALFTADGTDLLTARSRLGQFEKYFLPAFSVVIAVALGMLAFVLLSRVAAAKDIKPVAEPLRNFWVFVGIAFVSFLLAKYTAGLATQTPWRALRPGANYLMSCALASLLIALSYVVCSFGIPDAERVLAWAIPVMLGVLSAEAILLLVMSIYRPRVAGEERRWAHDSRLLGMLTTSHGILRTTAETLDYQFGFKVSETWFYRFMERALGPLILFQAATLCLLTSLVAVETGEQAVIERFGVPLQGAEPLGPGLHLKWPWPIEVCRRYPVERVEVLAIGEQLDEKAPGFLWTKTHAREPFNLLVANREEQAAAAPDETPAPDQPAPRRDRPPAGVSMLSGTVYVYYRVSDLYAYLYNHSDPKATLEALCYRELTRYAASADFIQLLGYQRGEAMAALKKAIQDAVAFKEPAEDSGTGAGGGLGLGVEIVDVTLQGIHPPVQVADAFEQVVGALEEKEAKTWQAKAYANSILPRAAAEAHRTVSDAQTYATARKELSPAVAKEFEMQLEAYNKAPSVFLHRKLMSAIEEALADVRKIIKPAWAEADEVINLKLDEKLPPGAGTGIDMTSTEEGMTP